MNRAKVNVVYVVNIKTKKNITCQLRNFLSDLTDFGGDGQSAQFEKNQEKSVQSV